MTQLMNYQHYFWNTYTKAEVDNLLYASCPSLSFIVDDFIQKLKLIQHSPVIQPQLNYILAFYSKGYVNQVLVQSATLFELYTRKEPSILYSQTKYLTPVMCHCQVIWTLVLHAQVPESDAMLN